MPFVKRNESGAIVAVYHQALHEDLDEVDSRDPELSNFLYDSLLDITARREWIDSDLSLVRVIEDLVDVLIEKGVIMVTDLPEAAQNKLRGRRGFRKQFAYVETLFGPDDADFSGGESGGGGFL